MIQAISEISLTSVFLISITIELSRINYQMQKILNKDFHNFFKSRKLNKSYLLFFQK